MTIKAVSPAQVSNPFSKRTEQLLLLCYYDPAGISTVPETVAFMQSSSAFPIVVLNLFEHGKNQNSVKLSPNLNISRFAGVVVHNSISYDVDNLRAMDSLLDIPLKGFQGVKVLMKQDENYRFKELAGYVGETHYDLIFTCLPPESIPLVYPESIVGNPRFSRMLTGYVTPTLRSLSGTASNRPIDIGYRGSVQPLSFGRLAYEKRQIGDEVIRRLASEGLTLNISSRWEDRIGNDAWFAFLASCKATLGAESGASVFDIRGDLAERCANAEAKYGPFQEDAAYAENYLSELREIEGAVDYNQISPRHFEAAATKTLQILYPGRYSDIFIAGRHYVELKRDFSNLDEVIAILLDETRLQQIVDVSHLEIIQNEKYWIETFVAQFDTLLDEIFSENPVKDVGWRSSEESFNVLLLAAHEPSIDPRLAWIAQGAPSAIKVMQIGVLPLGRTDIQRVDPRGRNLLLAKAGMPFDRSMLVRWYGAASKHPAGWAGLAELSLIANSLDLALPQFLELFNAPDNERVHQFKWYLNYVLTTAATILANVERVRGFHAVIATDLVTLPAALIVKGLTGVPVIYDAHEYWPEMDSDGLEFEEEYWLEMERRLVPHADYCQTVSPGLAELMTRQYGCKFAYVPNCEPLSSLLDETLETRNEEKFCKFIFQGGFAPCRGLDLLIDAWSMTDKRALLLLRGRDNDYRKKMMKRAAATGLLGTRIYFPDAVGEDELVARARDGDVGLIPYTPANPNYANCSPNKTTQYMAAGLPILANQTHYVAAIICESEAGVVTDFSQQKNIVASVQWFVDNPVERFSMGSRGRAYFREHFNWEAVSGKMYEKITSLVIGAKPSQFWVAGPKPLEDMYLPPKRRSDEKLVSAPLSSVRRIWRFLPIGVRLSLGPAVRSALGAVHRFTRD